MPPATFALSDPLPPGWPTIDTVQLHNTPVLKHVPKGARTLASVSLGRIIERLASVPTWNDLYQLILFPKYVFRAPPPGGKRVQAATKRQVATRAQDIQSMAVPDIWHAVTSDDKEPANKKNQRNLKRK